MFAASGYVWPRILALTEDMKRWLLLQATLTVPWVFHNTDEGEIPNGNRGLKHSNQPLNHLGIFLLEESRVWFHTLESLKRLLSPFYSPPCDHWAHCNPVSHSFCMVQIMLLHLRSRLKSGKCTIERYLRVSPAHCRSADYPAASVTQACRTDLSPMLCAVVSAKRWTLCPSSRCRKISRVN